MSNLITFDAQYDGEALSRGRFDLDINKELTPRVGRALERYNFLLLKTIRAKLGQRGSGVWYRSKKRDGTKHQASVLGEPPAIDRGVYQDSWETDYVTSADGNSVIATLYSTLWTLFGRRLELGGMGGGAYIAPRPHVRPALEESEPFIEAFLTDL